MKVAVGVLTRNQFANEGRHDLFVRTLRSLKGAGAPFDLYVVDNGSTDQSGEYVQSIGGLALHRPVTTCGAGMNAVAAVCLVSKPDLVVLSNDDIEWSEGFLPRLMAFWAAAPEKLLILSGLLEVEYPWNTIRAVAEYGGLRVLIRDTAPGGAWTFRARDWERIGPVPEAAGWDDVPTCQVLKNRGFAVAQADLAAHAGEGASTWGNESHVHAKPLDRAKWGI